MKKLLISSTENDRKGGAPKDFGSRGLVESPATQKPEKKPMDKEHAAGILRKYSEECSAKARGSVNHWLYGFPPPDEWVLEAIACADKKDPEVIASIRSATRSDSVDISLSAYHALEKVDDQAAGARMDKKTALDVLSRHTQYWMAWTQHGDYLSRLGGDYRGDEMFGYLANMTFPSEKEVLAAIGSVDTQDAYAVRLLCQVAMFSGLKEAKDRASTALQGTLGNESATDVLSPYAEYWRAMGLHGDYLAARDYDLRGDDCFGHLAHVSFSEPKVLVAICCIERGHPEAERLLDDISRFGGSEEIRNEARRRLQEK